MNLIQMQNEYIICFLALKWRNTWYLSFLAFLSKNGRQKYSAWVSGTHFIDMRVNDSWLNNLQHNLRIDMSSAFKFKKRNSQWLKWTYFKPSEVTIQKSSYISQSNDNAKVKQNWKVHLLRRNKDKHLLEKKIEQP